MQLVGLKIKKAQGSGWRRKLDCSACSQSWPSWTCKRAPGMVWAALPSEGGCGAVHIGHLASNELLENALRHICCCAGLSAHTAGQSTARARSELLTTS